MPHAIECRQLVKRYPGKPPVEAVRGLDLIVEEGECFGLLGPNGAGKTTTLEILEGLLEATSGEVAVLGYRWATHGAEIRERIGISLQETRMSDKLTVRETLEIIHAFRARGRTVMLTTHYMDEAERLCDRIAVVDHGRLIALGAPRALISQLGGANIIEFTLAEGAAALDEASLARLPSVRSVQRQAASHSLAVEQPHLALPALLARLQSGGQTLVHLTTRQATLEDVFVALTGRHLEEQEPANGAP